MEKNEVIIQENILAQQKDSSIENFSILFKLVLNGFFTLSIFILMFLFLYEVKSAMGIDLIPGWSLFH